MPSLPRCGIGKVFNAYITGHGAPGLGACRGSCKMLHPLYTLTTSVSRVGTEATDISRVDVVREWIVSGQGLYLTVNEIPIW